MVHNTAYLRDITQQLMLRWPENRTVNLVCHGHSVPSGYFATPRVDTLNAYPHLLHRGLNDRFPYAVVNVIVTGIGGENSAGGAGRFTQDVLCHHPDVVMIDYGLNDRCIGLQKAREAWTSMTEVALNHGVKVLLITPTWDNSFTQPNSENWISLNSHSEQIRSIAREYQVGLVDSFAAFEHYQTNNGDVSDLLSWSNHPNREGHKIVASLLLRWFSYV